MSGEIVRLRSIRAGSMRGLRKVEERATICLPAGAASILALLCGRSEAGVDLQSSSSNSIRDRFRGGDGKTDGGVRGAKFGGGSCLNGM